MLYNYVLFWNKNYNESSYDEVRNAIFEELYRYKYKDIQKIAAKSSPGIVNYIEITHTTDKRIEYKYFVDGTFIEQDIYEIGEYVLQYTDGTESRIPIVYGQNISNKDVIWDRVLDEYGVNYKLDYLLIEATSTSLPVRLDGTTFYKFIVNNLYPNKNIQSISLNNKSADKYKIFVNKIKFY